VILLSDDIALRVRGLGKKYRIGGPQEKYHTIRDAIVNSMRAPFRRLIRQGAEQSMNEFWALKDVSFDVHGGEVVGIIGRNGAGKSTLLKILSRITSPTKGEVEIHGRVGSLLEVGTGFHPELTGRENVFLSGSILGMRKREIDEKFDEIVKFSEIETFIDTPVKRYSSGMYVRLAFAVAAHLEPDILIVDEVLAVGDFQFQKKCLGMMDNVAKGGRTVLFVSHNMSAIQSLCERVLLIDHGSIMADGKANEVVRQYVTSVRDGDLYQPQPHAGYTDVVIKRAIISGENNLETDSFRPGERISITIEYNALKRIERPNFWITIRGPFGELFGANMLYDGACPDLIEGHGSIRCTFNGVYLLPQPYSIMLGIRAKNAYNNYIPATEIGTFFVMGTASDYNMHSEHAENFFETFYSIVVPYEWQLPDGQKISIDVPKKR
jgi:lipopolysaccharide transport system ATP-binding protein